MGRARRARGRCEIGVGRSEGEVGMRRNRGKNGKFTFRISGGKPELTRATLMC